MVGSVALTICLAASCSLIISLSFVSLAAARFAPAYEVHHGFLLEKVVPAYRRMLDWTLDHRLLTLCCLLALAASAALPKRRRSLTPHGHHS